MKAGLTSTETSSSLVTVPIRYSRLVPVNFCSEDELAVRTGGRGYGALPGVPQGRVTAARGQQLVVGAELGDRTVLDDGDAVGVKGGVQPVHDRDDRAAADHRRQRA